MGQDTDRHDRHRRRDVRATDRRALARPGRPPAGAAQHSSSGKLSLGPDIVVVFDGARRLRSLPGVVSLLKQGPALGIYSICLDTDERLLPEEASAVVLQTHAGADPAPAAGDRRRRDRARPARRAPGCNRVARVLAPIRDISGGDDDSVLPSACRLTEVMAHRTAHRRRSSRARWTLSPRSTEAVVGVSLDGPFAIDLRARRAARPGRRHDRRRQVRAAADDRGVARGREPARRHDLRARRLQGRRGVQGLRRPAAHRRHGHRPRHAPRRARAGVARRRARRAASTCSPRPGRRTSRTTSTCSAKRPELPAMPRLLIVIDEFASLARELPDFVTGLVNIAQRGRSLGIHLILATQRPGGVVSPEIRANTNLRIALRVTDASESSDVIDAPDAGQHLEEHARPRLRPARRQLAGAVPVRPRRWSPSGHRRPPRPARRGSPSSASRELAAADPDAAQGAVVRRRRGHRPQGAGRAPSVRPTSELGLRARSTARGCPR